MISSQLWREPNPNGEGKGKSFAAILSSCRKQIQTGNTTKLTAVEAIATRYEQQEPTYSDVRELINNTMQQPDPFYPKTLHISSQLLEKVDHLWKRIENN